MFLLPVVSAVAMERALLGLIATTKAGSVATAAVEAGLTAAGPLVASVIFIDQALAREAAVPWLTVPMELVPVGSGESGEKAVTNDGSAATAAVLAALTATGPLVASVILVLHALASVLAVP